MNLSKSFYSCRAFLMIFVHLKKHKTLQSDARSLKTITKQDERRQMNRLPTLLRYFVDTFDIRVCVFIYSITCTELRWQYPFRGKRMTCVESWFQPAFTELHMTSPISGKTSSIRALSPLSVILSPRSGATRTTKHSQGRDTRPSSWSWRQRSSSASMGCSWKYRASSYSRL